MKFRPTSYGISTFLALLSGLFILFINFALVPAVYPETWIYGWVLAAGIGSAFLLIGFVSIWIHHAAIFMISAVGSLLIFASTGMILERVYYIARGNNDAGQLFWFLALPMIFAGAQIYFSYQRLQRRTI